MPDTILVNRKDHPCNPVLINKEDKLEGDTLYKEKDEVKEPNEGTVAWYEMKLTEMEVDFSDAENKDDLIALFEENSEEE